MADDKKYSLISVDDASDEEVYRVDEHGVHVVRGAGEGLSGAVSAQDADASDAPGETDQASEAPAHGAEAKPAGSPAPAASDASAAEADDEEQQTLEDLEGSGPLPGMQRAIVIVLVLALVAFIAYFFIAHN